MTSDFRGGYLSFRRLHDLLPHFSPFERMLLYGFSILLSASVFILLAIVNNEISNRVPARGGSLIEGNAGTARFINPLLASSQADRDLTALVYSGLMRQAEDGSFVPDLAERYEITENGTMYTFHLKEKIAFHDGTPVTADDVAFTVALAQNPDIKSTQRADWEGVEVHTDGTTITFKLPSAYAPFLSNTTLGILPKHLWESYPASEFPFAPLNTNPVGSGPFKLVDATFDTTGAPTEYVLESFRGFTLGEPHLEHITYRMYGSEEELLLAYEAGAIDSFLALSPKTVPAHIMSESQVIEIPLSRVFAVFFNQNHASVLTNAAARSALDAAVDKEALIAQVLQGFGTPLEGPIPPSFAIELSENGTSTTESSQSAREILAKGGWKFETPNASSSESITETGGVWKRGSDSLSLSLATADTPELVETAEAIAALWRAAGIAVSVEVYGLTEFNQQILRPRQYDAALFGEVVGRPLDLFAFWHSSQRNDPGLNLALYTNATADKALAEARAETDRAKRTTLYQTFLAEVERDVPAIFLYSPHIVYVTPTYLHGVSNAALVNPAERFLGVYKWYRDTERVWQIFTH